MPIISTLASLSGRALGLLSGIKTLHTVVFTTSQSWTVPSGVNLLLTEYGHGQNGTADTTYSIEYYYTHYITRFYRRSDGGAEDVDGGTGGPTYGTTPPDYLGPFVATPDSTVYSGYNQIREYTQGFDTGGTPGTTGADASAFGNTFPGGVEVAATPLSFSNVAVTPSTGYTIIVPAGASITITYMK